MARADQRVLGYLGRALSLELSAVQLYSTQASLVSSWGLHQPAKVLREEAYSEMSHAERIIQRMLAVGVAPNGSQLRPAALGRSLDELLDIDIRFEWDLIELYSGAVEHCQKIGDYDDRMLFKGLLDEEQVHHRQLIKWQADLRGVTQ